VSLFGRQQRAFFGITGAQDLIPVRARTRQMGSQLVTADTAMRVSAVWACLRTRADLISTLPIEVYRMYQGARLDVTLPSVLVNPGGPLWDYQDWMYASQVDLDRTGNVFGLITERYGNGLPAVIELQQQKDCTLVQRKDGTLQYRIAGKEYTPDNVWHERQYVVPGLAVGLSPVAYAAWTLGEYMSIHQFALEWFSGGGRPAAHLRKTDRTLDKKEAVAVKEQFKATQAAGDVFVTGQDWEYKAIQAESTGLEWIEGKKFSLTDIARFFGVPADLIDASVAGENITYANISQRNLQFLIMQLGPAISRREKNLSKLLAQPRQVCLAADRLLRMDPETRTRVEAAQIASRTLAPSEVRAAGNRPPFTAEQLAEFNQFWPPKAAPPLPTTPLPTG
jgi:HK97 family phage portal protein